MFNKMRVVYHLIRKYVLMKKLKRSFYKTSREQINEFQKQRLKEIIQFARNNSPFYGSLTSNKYSELPIMNKQLMMENFDQINTAGLKKDDLFNFSIEQAKENKIDLFKNKYSVGMSSGTSGNKGLTILGPKERDNYTAVIFTRKGIPPGIKAKRILFALRRNNPSFMEVGKFGIKIVYIDYTTQIDTIIDLINTKNLTIIAGPPSLLTEIASSSHMINHRIDTIISYAEVLSDDIKERIQREFKAPVVQIYQGSEGFIASTCKKGFLHINEDLVYVDLQKYDNNIGRIIITDLFRTTQPILRYELNDVIEIDETSCACGSEFRKIAKIHGRSDDIFKLLDKDGIERNLFPDYIRRSIIQTSNDIIEYQAIQISYTEIEIRLVLNKKIDRSNIENGIRSNLKYYTDKLSVEITSIMIKFSEKYPEKNIRSHKMIRVRRDF